MKEHTSVVTRKGQVTIPAEIRRALDLQEGDTVTWIQEGEEIRLTAARYTVESAFGSVKPRRQPEDFEEMAEKAKAAKALESVSELQGV